MYMNETERSQTVARLSADLAGALPGDWTPELRTDWGARLTRRDGLQLWLSLDGWKGRASCSPSVPTDNGGCMSLRSWGVIAYDAPAPAAGFALGRDTATVAREIVRKVLEPYEPLWRAILEKKAEREDGRNGAVRLAEDLAGALGDTTWQDRRKYNGRSDITLYLGAGDEPSGQVRIAETGGYVEVRMTMRSDDMARSFGRWVAQARGNA